MYQNSDTVIVRLTTGFRHYDDMQETPAPTDQGEQSSSVPDPLKVQVTVEAFYELLEGADLDDVFEEFIVPRKPHDGAPC